MSVIIVKSESLYTARHEKKQSSRSLLFVLAVMHKPLFQWELCPVNHMKTLIARPKWKGERTATLLSGLHVFFCVLAAVTVMAPLSRMGHGGVKPDG